MFETTKQKSELEKKKTKQSNKAMNNNSHTSIAIGIDLGTTYCCVAAYCPDKGVTILTDPTDGSRTCPSYISFVSSLSCPLIGAQAKVNAMENSANTIFDIKRIIGRGFDDSSVQNDLSLFPFRVSRDSRGQPLILLDNGKAPKTSYTTEELSALLIQHMKTIAERALGCRVTNAVITVPAYFNDSCRSSTKSAAQIAGLNVLRILNEPTAAAIAYGVETKCLNSQSELRVLIFDLGGGTFDCSLVVIDRGIYQVKATAGQNHLGGEDFDNEIVKWAIMEMDQKHKTWFQTNDKLMKRLKLEAEAIKCKLSNTSNAVLKINETIDEVEVNIEICLQREQFNEMCETLFQRTVEPMEQVLRDSHVDKHEIDQIVMIGGSTRIPRIQQIVKQFFNDKELNMSINPDEAVAYGAAIQAAILHSHQTSSPLPPLLKEILLIDVIPLSLGVEIAGGIMQKLIVRNSPIPISKTQVFSTHVDNQTTVLIQVFEGDRTRTCDNHLLGQFELTGITKQQKGIPEIYVTFSIDSNGILAVSATEQLSKASNQILIASNRQRLSTHDIDEMMLNVAKFQSQDQSFAVIMEAKTSLELYIAHCKHFINKSNHAKTLTLQQRQQLEQAIDNVNSWLLTHSTEETTESTIFQDKQRELESICQPLLTSIISNHNSTPYNQMSAKMEKVN